MGHDADILPTLLNPGDLCAGDEATIRLGNPAHYAAFVGGELSPEAQHELERGFHEAVQAWLAGEARYEAILPFVDALVLDSRPRWGGREHHDSRPLLPAEVPLPDEVLADLVEDEVPDAAVLLERITGDPYAPPTVATIAALAWLETLGPNRRAVDAWADDERERPLVQTMNRVDRAPACLYVDGLAQLPLNPKMCPPEGPAGVYVARAYRLGAGWAFSTKVDLPAAPDVAVLMRRIRVELWRLRIHERRSTWEDVLRKRSEVLYRAAMEGARRTLAAAATGVRSSSP